MSVEPGTPAPPGGRPRVTVYVVLPAYNEGARIGRLLDRLDEALQEADTPYKVVLVDDGSRDATAEIVAEHGRRMPIHVLRHAENLGLGPTIRDGLFEAASLAADRDILVTMDADDTHTPGLIRRMVRMIAEGHDVVVASRFRSGSRVIGVPIGRRILSYAASLLFRILFPVPGLRDFTCGYRAYRADVVKLAIRNYGDTLFEQDGFHCMVDILLKLRAMELIFGEVPFILRYDVKEGGTKMNVSRTIRDTLLLAVRRRLGR